MKELGTIYKEIQQLENKIATDIEKHEQVQQHIEDKFKLEQKEQELKQLTTEAAASVIEWKPDRISKGKKDIYTEGSFSILRSSRTIRKIIPKKFVELYPLEANVMIEDGKINIPVGIVEAVIGKNKTNDICEANVSYSYELLSRNLPEIVKHEQPEEPKIEKTKKTKTTKTKKTKVLA
jgi:hypothetical protein